ncbi:MAG: PDZ domain-containing protein [Chloroflexota bacterium]
MRKFIAALSMMVLVTAVIGTGVIFAQDDDTPAATGTAMPDARWLGVGVTEGTQQVIVAQVQPGSPAESAQLAVGDVIVALNGTPITSVSELSADILAVRSGDTVMLDLLRKGKLLTVDVTLASAGAGATLNSGLDPLVVASTLLSAQITQVAEGYQVTTVSATLNPFKLAVDDVVTTINGQKASQLDLTVLQKDLGNQALPLLTIKIMRAGSEVTLHGQPPVGSLSFGRPGNQEDASEGNHRDDQNGGEGEGEGGEGSPTLVAPNLASPTPAIQPESTLAAETYTQL